MKLVKARTERNREMYSRLVTLVRGHSATFVPDAVWDLSTILFTIPFNLNLNLNRNRNLPCPTEPSSKIKITIKIKIRITIKRAVSVQVEDCGAVPGVGTRPGTGLGLLLVKRCAELHQGKGAHGQQTGTRHKRHCEISSAQQNHLTLNLKS